MDKDKIRTAVIGAGKMGSIHAKVYSQLPDSELVAVVDADAPRLGGPEPAQGQLVDLDAPVDPVVDQREDRPQDRPGGDDVRCGRHQGDQQHEDHGDAPQPAALLARPCIAARRRRDAVSFGRPGHGFAFRSHYTSGPGRFPSVPAAAAGRYAVSDSTAMTSLGSDRSATVICFCEIA